MSYGTYYKMITAIVLYDLPPHIDKESCRAHFHAIAPGFLEVPGLLRKQFIHAAEGGFAGGSYLWESRTAAEAFYSGSWLDGIIARYGAPPRITYFDTFAIADVPARQAVVFDD
ncbi:YdhR family protein [Rhodopila sp.]|uniref:YdhR family protein n=1 Tax=Rhodopila sp. TaxID=2480087 RepID=UPI003D0D0EE2